MIKQNIKKAEDLLSLTPEEITQRGLTEGAVFMLAQQYISIAAVESLVEINQTMEEFHQNLCHWAKHIHGRMAG